MKVTTILPCRKLTAIRKSMATLPEPFGIVVVVGKILAKLLKYVKLVDH